MTAEAYGKDGVAWMERELLCTLEFQIARPTAMRYLERYRCVAECKGQRRSPSRYLLELTLMEAAMAPTEKNETWKQTTM